MTPLITLIIGLLLALVCSMLETAPANPNNATVYSVIRVLRTIGLIMFGVGLFYYVK